MNKLTEEEIKEYICEPNKNTGVDGISREYLEKIDLDTVEEVIYEVFSIKSKDGNHLYKYDTFTPRAGSIYLKPSFGGTQVLMGRVGRKLFFSNGQWFSIN